MKQNRTEREEKQRRIVFCGVYFDEWKCDEDKSEEEEEKKKQNRVARLMINKLMMMKSSIMFKS